MSSRTDKIWSYLSARVTELALQRLRDTGKDEKFWIVSVVSVRVSSDFSYADVYVDSIFSPEDLPKALAPIAGALRTDLSRKVGLHRAPIIRFRTKADMKGDNANPETKVLELLDEISRKHAGA